VTHHAAYANVVRLQNARQRAAPREHRNAPRSIAFGANEPLRSAPRLPLACLSLPQERKPLEERDRVFSDQRELLKGKKFHLVLHSVYVVIITRGQRRRYSRIASARRVRPDRLTDIVLQRTEEALWPAAIAGGAGKCRELCECVCVRERESYRLLWLPGTGGYTGRGERDAGERSKATIGFCSEEDGPESRARLLSASIIKTAVYSLVHFCS